MSQSTVLIDRLSRWQRQAGIIGILGMIASAAGFAFDRPQFFRSWLFGGLFWAGLSMGALGIYLMHNVVGGNWGVIMRRPLESASRTIWITGILLAPIFAGMAFYYPWARPDAAHDPNLVLKAPYLNLPFFAGRFVFYFLLWSFFAYRLSAMSAKTDSSSDKGIQIRMRQFGSPALLVFVLTATFAFFDWVMSLEPHWFSTMYGGMYLIGQALAAIAFVIILLERCSDQSPIRENLDMPLWHNLGNMMLAFTMLWAYLSFSQLIIIWSGNLPEEISWYLTRFTNGWGPMAWSVAVFNFCVPFFILLHRFVKKNPKLLVKVCIGMFVMRLVDVFWLSQPPLRPNLFFSWMDLATFAGIGGIWLYFFFQDLKGRPLVPLRDSRLLVNRKAAHHV